MHTSRLPPIRRDPNTTSARPSRIGEMIDGMSAGSYSRSASCTITMRPRAWANRVRTPRLSSYSSRGDSSSTSSAFAATRSSVPSLEQSSTTMIWSVNGNVRSRMSTARIVAHSWCAGTTIVSSGRSTSTPAGSPRSLLSPRSSRISAGRTSSSSATSVVPSRVHAVSEIDPSAMRGGHSRRELERTASIAIGAVAVYVVLTSPFFGASRGSLTRRTSRRLQRPRRATLRRGSGVLIDHKGLLSSWIAAFLIHFDVLLMTAMPLISIVSGAIGALAEAGYSSGAGSDRYASRS